MSQWQGRQWLAVTLYSLVMCQVRACADLVVLNAAVGACGKETKLNFWSYIHVMEIHWSTGLCILAAAVQGQPVVTGAAVDAGPRTWRNKKAGFGSCGACQDAVHLTPDIVTWNTMLGAWAKGSEWQRSLHVFEALLNWNYAVRRRQPCSPNIGSRL